MYKAYVIEAGDEPAGIVIREGTRFRFSSSSRLFWGLEGAYYATPADAERAARRLAALPAAPSATWANAELNVGG